MPVCVDCERWSPGTFRSCPDCAGALKLEPLWARPTKDPQLGRLDWEAKWWHRRARDETQPDAARAEAWAMVADRRDRYEDLRRRLRPVLETAEARRLERLEAGARAAGVTVRAYEAQVARGERWWDEAAERELKELGTALEAGLITRKEHDRRVKEARDSARARADEAAARSEGLAIAAYRRRAQREQDERERLWGSEVPDPGWSQGWLLASMMAVLITGVAGVVLVVVFLLAGRSPIAAIAGSLLGGFAGWAACQAVFFGGRRILDQPGSRSRLAQAIIEPTVAWTLVGILIVPSVTAVLVALWLS